MQTHAQAVEPLLAAMKAALAGAAGVTNLLAGGAAALHDGEAPVSSYAGEPAPSYLVFTNPSSEDNSVFMKIGGDVRRQVDIWTDTEAKAIALATQVSIVLDGTVLSLSGVAHVYGLTRILGVFRDPGRRHLYHGVVQYEGLVR